MTDKSILPPRPTLEAAAKEHGVTVSPSMTPRAIAEAVAEKIQPGVYKFQDKSKSDAYAAKAFEIAVAEAVKPAAPPPAPKPAAPPAPTVASPSVPAPGAKLNGSANLISAEAARDRAIQTSLRGGTA